MYYMIAPTNSDLYHHGILGQKWGKQNGPPYPLGSGDHSSSENKAGWRKSLSSEGKTVESEGQRLGSKLLSNREKSQNYSDSAGIYMNYKEDIDEFNSYLKDNHTIKSGTEISRFTNSKETLDDKRKYVALMNRDKQDYLNSFGLLKNEDNPILYHDTYKFKKDVKFANADDVWTYLLDNYGSKKQKEAYNFKREIEKKGLTTDSYYMTHLNSKQTPLSKKEVRKAQQLINIANKMDTIGGWKAKLYDDKKINNDVINHFKKQGYDAIIDIEDSRTWGVAPLIILDPANSMEFSRSKHY